MALSTRYRSGYVRQFGQLRLSDWLLTSTRRSAGTGLIDLHTHSNASDGTLTPYELVDRAAAAGIQIMALTDHDTIAGFVSVKDSVPSVLRLVSGVELSCQWGRVGIHVVGLGFDPDSQVLLKHIEGLNAARLQRAEMISQRLAQKGMKEALAGALLVAAGAQIGRPHFAQWMVAQGYVQSEAEAFKRFLGKGKVGDITAVWPDLLQTVETICAAGGYAVLAHPLHYRLTATRLHALCAAFAEAGGSAIEVINGRPVPGEEGRLVKLAAAHDLLFSVGSDFHRDTEYGAGLGVDTARFQSGSGLWERL
jgi:predicted metal-dependent phosphoesterase TrpH